MTVKKENIIDIEFKEVFAKWAWNIVKCNVENIETSKYKITIKRGKNEVSKISIKTNLCEISLTWYGLICESLKTKVENIINEVNEECGIKTRWRAEKGKYYYYVSNKCEIKEDMDCFYDTDNDRYEVGNYYETIEEINMAISMIKEIHNIDFKNKINNKIIKQRVSVGEFFYFINTMGIVNKKRECYSNEDDLFYKFGNYFLTEKQAENMLTKTKELYNDI